jgi:hypothetical protein
MRYLLILTFAGLFLAGCSKSDRELITGKWAIESIKTNGEFLYSGTKAEQEKVIDRIVRQQMEMVAPEAQTGEQAAMLRKVYSQHIAQLGKMVLDIKADDSFIFSSYNGSEIAESKGTLKIDEEKKELYLKSTIDEKFTYTLKDNSLTLDAKEGQGSTQLIFKRK